MTCAPELRLVPGSPSHRSFVGRLSGEAFAAYGDYANAPQELMEGFGQNLVGEGAPDPQNVAEAVAGLVNTPAGERPFRTVVDELGMKEPIESLNQGSAQVTAGIYNAFEMGEMLKLRTNS